jgi:hypothetical protein
MLATQYIRHVELFSYFKVPTNSVVDPELFARSGSGQPLSGMNLKQNFPEKIPNFSIKCTMKINKNIFFSNKNSVKSLSYKNMSIVTDRYACHRYLIVVDYVYVFLALPDTKQDPDPESEPKQIISDPQPCLRNPIQSGSDRIRNFLG